MVSNKIIHAYDSYEDELHGRQSDHGILIACTRFGGWVYSVQTDSDESTTDESHETESLGNWER
jgi:hypothetical protein